MNNWILVISLSFLFVLLFLINNKKFGPQNLMVLSFLGPAILVVYYEDYIRYEVGLFTIFVVVLLISMFSLGVFLQPKVKSREYLKYSNAYFVVNKKISNIFLTVVILNLFVQYRYLMQLGAIYGASNIIAAYSVARLALVDYQNTGIIDVRMPYYGIILSVFASIIGKICFHVYVYNRFVRKENDRRLLWVVIVYFMSLLFATGRAAFLPVLVHAVYVVMVILSTKMSIHKIIKKCLKQISMTVIVGIAFFSVLGAMRQNADGDYSYETDNNFTITTYFAAPILGLDVYLKKGAPRSDLFGEHAFKEFYDYARIFGASFQRSQFHKEDFYAGNISSNVFTGLYYWISDFSIFGACFYALFWGAVVGYFYRRKVSPSNIVGVYFRSLLYYSIIQMFYDDQFNSIVSFFTLFGIYIIILFQKKCRYIKHNNVPKYEKNRHIV